MYSQVVDQELSIEAVCERHAADTFSLIDQNREYLMEWLPWVDQVNSVEDSQNHARYCVKERKAGRSWDGTMIYKGNAVGRIGFHSFDRSNRSTSLGYWLAPSHQGRGIVTRCVESLVTTAICRDNFNRIEIRTGLDNHKSQAIPERLKFKFEGIQRQAEWLYDRFVDLRVYAILASEWPQSSENTTPPN